MKIVLGKVVVAWMQVKLQGPKMPMVRQPWEPASWKGRPSVEFGQEASSFWAQSVWARVRSPSLNVYHFWKQRLNQ